MDALSFLKEFRTTEVEQVCARAGTSVAYFRQIAYGHRRPSAAMAEKLVDASSHRLDVMSLLFPPRAVQSTAPPEPLLGETTR